MMKGGTDLASFIPLKRARKKAQKNNMVSFAQSLAKAEKTLYAYFTSWS